MISRRDMLAATAAALVVPLPQLGAQARRFLTPAEFALLDELSEMIIPTDDHSPGARAAGVASYIDARLVESLEPAWKASWRAGLKAVNDLSRQRAGKAFLGATPAQRVEVLTQMAAAESDPKTPLDNFFKELKWWTVFGYYTSKIGIHDDQQYKGNVVQTGDYAGFDPT